MGREESKEPSRERKESTQEILDPRHFYAAYIFNQAEAHSLNQVVEKSVQLGYLVRYWWLSEAMDLQGSEDRLIICVHHPSDSEEAGSDLYEALREENVIWDDFEAATVEEYGRYGKPVEKSAHLQSPDRHYLFPDAHFGALASEFHQRMEDFYGITLQNDREAVVWLDQWLEAVRMELPTALFGQVADLCGAFIGEYLRKTIGGNWQYQEEERRWGVKLSKEFFAIPQAKVYKQLRHGTSDSILAYVTVIELMQSAQIRKPGE